MQCGISCDPEGAGGQCGLRYAHRYHRETCVLPPEVREVTPSGKWKPISQFPEKCWLLVAKNLPRKPLSSPRSFLDIGTLSFFFFFFKFFSFFVFRDRDSLYSPGTHCVDQADFKLTENFLPLPLLLPSTLTLTLLGLKVCSHIDPL